MKKLQLLNDLKLNLNQFEIDFSEITPNKRIQMRIGSHHKINLVVSCEQDECGAFLKVDVKEDEDLFCMFETNSSREFTSSVSLAKKIRKLTKQLAELENL